MSWSLYELIVSMFTCFDLVVLYVAYGPFRTLMSFHSATLYLFTFADELNSPRDDMPRSTTWHVEIHKGYFMLLKKALNDVVPGCGKSFQFSCVQVTNEQSRMAWSAPVAGGACDRGCHTSFPKWAICCRAGSVGVTCNESLIDWLYWLHEKEDSLQKSGRMSHGASVHIGDSLLGQASHWCGIKLNERLSIAQPLRISCKSSIWRLTLCTQWYTKPTILLAFLRETLITCTGYYISRLANCLIAK